MIKSYYQLTKPGIVYGNALTAIFGFLVASKSQFNLPLFLTMLLGISLVVASACVFNNFIDQGIDKVMERTKRRPLVKGEISGRSALIYGTILGVLGVLTLFLFANPLTALVGIVGFFFYVVMYSYFKRRSILGTEVGSISGAVPPVVGYTALTNRLDLGALILFLILVFWQMPHFYGIAVFRLKDYAAVKMPVLPVKKGVGRTKFHLLFYLIAFLITAPLLAVYGYAGKIYFGVVVLLGLIWLVMGIEGFVVKDDIKWAKKVFFFSLIIIMALCLVIPIDRIV